jgi:hypothetical protein
LIEREWNENPGATNYGCEQTEEHDRRGHRPREREAPLEKSDHWKQHKSQHSSPHEWPDDVSRAIHDVERGDRKKGDHDALGRAAPTGSHAAFGIIRPPLAFMGSDRSLPRYLKW